jgi:hypothetical protein
MDCFEVVGKVDPVVVGAMVLSSRKSPLSLGALSSTPSAHEQERYELEGLEDDYHNINR